MAYVSSTGSEQRPTLSGFIFGDRRLAPFWFLLRLWLGFQWLQSGLDKLQDPAWMNGGVALKGFWKGALVMQPRPVIAYDWYRAFIEALLAGGHYVWFGKAIACGEFAVGLGIILGAFTVLASAGGLMLNVNYMLAGSASTNFVFAAVEILVILGWKVAGAWGLDHWLLDRVHAMALVDSLTSYVERHVPAYPRSWINEVAAS